MTEHLLDRRGILLGLARISHTIFAQSGSFARRFVSFVRDVLARGVRDASGAGTFHGLRRQ
jgi:hypothetical protein